MDGAVAVGGDACLAQAIFHSQCCKCVSPYPTSALAPPFAEKKEEHRRQEEIREEEERRPEAIGETPKPKNMEEQ